VVLAHSFKHLTNFKILAVCGLLGRLKTTAINGHGYVVRFQNVHLHKLLHGALMQKVDYVHSKLMS